MITKWEITFGNKKVKTMKTVKKITLGNAVIRYNLANGETRQQTYCETIVGYWQNQWFTTDMVKIIEERVKNGFWCNQEFVSPNYIVSALILERTTFDIDEPEKVPRILREYY